MARPVSTSMNDVGFRNISESAADLCKTLAKLACLVATNDLEAELVAYNFYCLIFSDKTMVLDQSECAKCSGELLTETDSESIGRTLSQTEMRY